jgi:hypothetical protein
MRKKPLTKFGWIALAGLLIVGACQDENSEKISSEQAGKQSAVTAKDNNEIIGATQEAIEITSGVFDDEGISSGRASSSGRISGERKGGDHHHGCEPSISGSFDLDRSHEDSLIYTGSLAIDYGDGASCDPKHVRKGKITDSFTVSLGFNNGMTYSSTETITFEGFVKDSVQLDGVFIIKKSKGNPRTIEAQNATITYRDGTTVSWDGTLSYEYDRGEDCKWKDNSINVTGSISGTNREENDFVWEIQEALVYKYACDKHHRFHPVSGTVEVSVGGVVSTVDYGNGSCDKKFTVTTDGVTTEETFESGHD